MLWIFIGFLLVAMVLHELAHAFYMMRNGIEIKTIALFFPPLALKKEVTWKKIQDKPITLALGLIPLGAFVDATDEGQKQIGSLNLGKKVSFYAAGVASHFVTILALFAIPYMWGSGWDFSPAILIIFIGSAVLSLIFFVRPAFAGMLFMVMGLLALGFIVWSIVSLGLDGTFIGPIGMGKMAIATTSAIQLVGLAVAVSLSLGMLNAMPFMPLDGGHIFFAFLGKFFSEKKLLPVQKMASVIGWVVLLSFMIFIVMRDVQRFLFV